MKAVVRLLFQQVIGTALVLAGGPAIVPSTGWAETPKRPSIIVVMTDDQGYGDLSCHGHPVLKTPHLDKLHGESLRLTNFHVDPTCSPTRAALMTGRYSGRVGVWHTIMGRSLLESDELTVAEVLSQAGYATGMFGKWHLGDNYPMRPQDQGFQQAFYHGGGGVGHTPDFWGNDYFDDTYFRDGKPEAVEGYCTDVWFDAALAFIEKHRDEPFFCYLVTNAPHSPFLVADKYAAPYRDHPDVPNAEFLGMIANIDENMGRLVERLEAWDLTQDTLLIFTTDNGTAAGIDGRRGFNAGMRGKKGSHSDGGHRVPCGLRWPAGGFEGGRDITPLTAHIDLLPTLAELAGVARPDDVSWDGTSLLALLRGTAEDWPERTLVVESQRVPIPQKWRQAAVMTDRWRLVNRDELYDMRADPGQQTNVADQHTDVVERLRAAYDRWWDDVHATSADRVARIVLGHEAANPATLTAHDWLGERTQGIPWNQSHIRNGLSGNGAWAVTVHEAGRYVLELRRWPPEADRPIHEGPGPRAEQARLQVGEQSWDAAVADDDAAVAFSVDLPAGPTKLQTWFIDAAGNSRGAYYLTVRRVTENP